jgi:SAM-dependent methyltransferase
LPNSAESFISRWEHSSASERANYALFLSELCDLIDVPRPEPSTSDEAANSYVIDKAVFFKELDGTSTTNFIDLYKRNCFVLEAKQGSNPKAAASPNSLPSTRKLKRGTAIRGTHGWDEAMLAARAQAERYAKALPTAEGWPPFLIVADVGHSIELYADFSLTGKAYLPFPDPRTFRILLDQLAQPLLQERLRAIWLDPLSLDPARETARVTREVAGKLATLARNLELQHSPKEVAEFLTRCIFTSFAEDVKLLPERSWLNLLQSLRDDVANFPTMAQALWQTMNDGGFSPILRAHILKFNGGLFESTKALPLTPDQLGLLIEAADSRWRDVEPAIFGTLLERALDRDERHALGAHYTPRAYVERLVIPTLVEPLRDDWRNALAVITQQVNAGDQAAAIDTGQAFHRQLCSTRVLDPACGSGNFLYVALEHMKRLEGEVLETLRSLGETQQALEHTGFTVDPHQLLGIELNPRAAVIADLVLWIGYLQWHFRTRGDAQPPIPVIRNFHNIVEADALLTWKKRIPALDKAGEPITQWDGVTKKQHPTTGKDVPDETARRTVYEYVDAKRYKWPEADFIVGNPPFIGAKYVREELGDGYALALRQVYDSVPESADYVMYWWQRAAELARASKLRRFGLITTNSLPQVFNRKVVAQSLNATQNALSLVFAIPDHPWMKSTSALEDVASYAAVRIAMTVAELGEHQGHLYEVVSEGDIQSEGTVVTLAERLGHILPDLKIGLDLAGASALKANAGLSTRGVALHGGGFLVNREEAASLGYEKNLNIQSVIHPYLSGRDVVGRSRNLFVIDLHGKSQSDAMRGFPEIYQWVYDRVKPERDQNHEASRKNAWWQFGRQHTELRRSIKGLKRFISTTATAKHRIFVFVSGSVTPDDSLVNFGSQDAYFLGVLSSRAHIIWALAAGTTLEDRPRYIQTRCFDPFPFPDCTEALRTAIRDVAERLDAHRKRQQELHPWLTLTGMYNVLEKLRSGEAFTEEDRNIYEAGLVGILRLLHDELDAVVFDAYDWTPTLTTERILEKLVALNAKRHAEEAGGLVRWLRPEFQAPNALPTQATLGGLLPAEAATAKLRKQPWPATLTDQVRVVKDSLRAQPLQTAQQIASGFKPASRTRIAEILETLTALGQTRLGTEDRYTL